MLSMPPLIFPGYTLLKEAVNKHDYSFYPLIRNSSIVEPYTWDEVSRKEAEEVEKDIKEIMDNAR